MSAAPSRRADGTRLLAAGVLATGLAGPFLPLPLWLRGLLLPPALFWAPFAPWCRRGTALSRLLGASWLGVALSVVSVSLVRELGLPPWSLLLPPLLVHLAGWLRPASPARLEPGPRLGLLALAAAVALGGLALRRQLALPLSDYWWDPGVEEVLGRESWAEARAPGLSPWGDPEAGALAGELPAGRHPLELERGSPLVLLVQGEVGTRLRLLRDGRELGRAVVKADPVVLPEEGPVARYLDRGVAALVVEAGPGPLEVELDRPARLVLLPSPAALWSLDALGLLRYVHYYQLLNLVENLRWARELLSIRRLTVHQPPLWSYVLAPVSALLTPELPGASLLFLWVVLLAGASTLRLLEVLAPRAPPLLWTLPAAGSALQLRLMALPGSVDFPDNLYAAALLGALAALLARPPEPLRFAGLGLAASLLRYPGVLLLGAAGLLGLRERRWRPFLALLAALGASLALAAAAGLASGQWASWVEAVRFEILPEHWHGQGDPGLLLPRVPDFYLRWLRYAGGAPLLALLVARGRALGALGLGFLYSLLLCTIDHFPTHYFLPLVQLSWAVLAAGLAGRGARWRWPLLLLAGAGAFAGLSLPP